MPQLSRDSFALRIVAFSLKEAWAELLSVSGFPYINGECEQHAVVLISAPQVVGNQWTKGQVLTPEFARVFSHWGCPSNVQQARS